jgi:hypothetical protein
MPSAKAGAQCRVPVPSPPPRHGGRRGRWGQARLVEAGEANGGRKPPGQIPSQQLQTQYCSNLYYLIQVKCPVLNFVGGILAKVKVNN